MMREEAHAREEDGMSELYHYDDLQKAFHTANKLIEELEDDNERLRGALQQVADSPQGCDCLPSSGCNRAQIFEVVRRALNPTDEIKRLRVIAADYQALQHRANTIDDENERLRAACNLVIEALNVLGIDAWSDAPHLMRELRAALDPRVRGSSPRTAP